MPESTVTVLPSDGPSRRLTFGGLNGSDRDSEVRTRSESCATLGDLAEPRFSGKRESRSIARLEGFGFLMPSWLRMFVTSPNLSALEEAESEVGLEADLSVFSAGFSAFDSEDSGVCC